MNLLLEHREKIYVIINFMQSTGLEWQIRSMLLNIIFVPINLICLYLYPNVLTLVIFCWSIIAVFLDVLIISCIILTKKWIYSEEKGFNYNIAGYCRFIWFLLTDKIILLLITPLLLLFSKQFL